MRHSAADVLSQWMLDEAIADISTWPVSVDSMPDSGDGFITCYNTSPKLDGRFQATGERLQHPGIQIRVRAQSNPDAYNKAKEIQLALDSIYRRSVTMDGGEAYLIQAASLTSGPISLGEEAGTQRFIYTINTTLSVSEV